jgi:large subunit ribosomal protein L21e
MVKSSKGFRSRTRGVLTKEPRERGLRPVTQYLKSFEVGEKVTIKLEASDPHGQPHPRYQGRTCTVLGRIGRAYRLEFVDGGKRKQLIATPIHLQRTSASAPKESKDA